MTLWVNKVGPYDNPQETYNYYELPFCRYNEEAAGQRRARRKWGGLGEVLLGNQLVDSELPIGFLEPVEAGTGASGVARSLGDGGGSGGGGGAWPGDEAGFKDAAGGLFGLGKGVGVGHGHGPHEGHGLHEGHGSHERHGPHDGHGHHREHGELDQALREHGHGHGHGRGAGGGATARRVFSSSVGERHGGGPGVGAHICSQRLSEDDVAKFAYAIENHYWFEYFLDDLPIWGFVGEELTAEEAEAKTHDAAEAKALAAKIDMLEEEVEEGGHGRDKKRRKEAHEVRSAGSANSAGEDHHDGSAEADELKGIMKSPHVYTHRAFTIAYNGDRIIHVSLVSSHPMPLRVGAELEFTYSVSWEPSDIPYTERFDRYLDENFFEHKIHWFSLFNSFMMVIFLVGLVFMILMRTLSRDYLRYTKDLDDDLEGSLDAEEESGWKLVHGDVFRAPRQLVILSALVGTGAQLAVLCLLVILLAIAGSQHETRGALLTSMLVGYALTSGIGGYVSGGMYARHDGRKWIACMLATATLFPGILASVAATLNTIALVYGSLAAVPFTTILVVAVIWSLVSVPLCLLGTVIGRNWAGVPDNPCRVKTIPRQIPDKAWYLDPLVVRLAMGVLPFGSIFIEMYFIFTSFWNYKVYYVFGFMLLVFVILSIVTLCVTVVATYFLLNAENYNWQWTSFLGGASTALYVYLYAVYYFFAKTHMSGFFQTCFYFGYSAMFCAAIAAVCGTISYAGANTFVRRIYRNIKCD